MLDYFMKGLLDIFLEWLRKQAGSVVLLCVAVAALYFQIDKLEAKIHKSETRIEELNQRIITCEVERAALQKQVEFLLRK
jgi:cell division protein FtsB